MNGQLGKELAEFERQEALLRTITAQKEEIERLRADVALLLRANEEKRAVLEMTFAVKQMKKVALKAENERLRGALEWYADQNNWARNHGMDAWAIRKERGFRARAALQAPESENK